MRSGMRVRVPRRLPRVRRRYKSQNLELVPQLAAAPEAVHVEGPRPSLFKEPGKSVQVERALVQHRWTSSSIKEVDGRELVDVHRSNLVLRRVHRRDDDRVHPPIQLGELGPDRHQLDAVAAPGRVEQHQKVAVVVLVLPRRLDDDVPGLAHERDDSAFFGRLPCSQRCVLQGPDDGCASQERRCKVAGEERSIK